MDERRYAARCGIFCGECGYRAETGCPGCVEAAGVMFWGTCPIAVCCVGRGHEHCGLCEEFPCETLTAFANDAEHGDGGRRIRQLEAWNDVGFDAWVARRKTRS